jgi:hypothetical protein
MAAPVEDRNRQTLREPAAGVMDLLRSGQSSDSESRSLRTAGLGQPAGPRHSPAPTGVRRGTSDRHCWIGSKAVEITGRRVGRRPMFIISLVVITAIMTYWFCCFSRFPMKYERFCAHYVPNNIKTRNRRNGVALEIDESKMCPFAKQYDADLHDFVSNLRRVDGSIPVHPQYGPPYCGFSLQKVPANAGYARRLQSWGERLAFILYTSTLCVTLLISVGGRYFLFLILDKAVCPFLVKYFEMLIWHPTSEKSLDELLNVKVDL